MGNQSLGNLVLSYQSMNYKIMRTSASAYDWQNIAITADKFMFRDNLIPACLMRSVCHFAVMHSVRWSSKQYTFEVSDFVHIYNMQWVWNGVHSAS
jgi:hypothetical protein